MGFQAPFLFIRFYSSLSDAFKFSLPPESFLTSFAVKFMSRA